MPESPLAYASDITVRYGARTVLDQVSLTVSEGEIVTLIGPNGAGKSTLVRVILGLMRPQAGSVGRRKGITLGYAPQRALIDPVLPLSVERFLTLGVRATRAQLEAVLVEVGVAHVLESPVQAVSGGEFQRVLLARALLRDPDLLILDEPVQGVDVRGQEELYALIRRVRDRRGCGILMVSHDLHLVMAATDRVVCLDRSVCCSGEPGAVSNDPAYRALFPRATAELALYTHHHHEAGSPCAICHLREEKDHG